jgi:hypothetical protein
LESVDEFDLFVDLLIKEETAFGDDWRLDMALADGHRLTGLRGRISTSHRCTVGRYNLTVSFPYGPGIPNGAALAGARVERLRGEDMRARAFEYFPPTPLAPLGAVADRIGERYRALCDVETVLNDLLRDHFIPGATFYSDSAKLWQLVESRLFPHLHKDEKTKLTELYHHPTAWKQSDFDLGVHDAATETFSGGSGQTRPYQHELEQSKTALFGLKNLVGSWAAQDRPPMRRISPSTSRAG